jgi:hypothetical protein
MGNILDNKKMAKNVKDRTFVMPINNEQMVII